jgi:hypothetical protein
MYRIAAMAFFVVSCSVSAAPRVRVEASPEPANYAWWLRTEIYAAHTSIRGIPIWRLGRDLKLALELRTRYIPAELLYEGGADNMKESGLAFPVSVISTATEFPISP